MATAYRLLLYVVVFLAGLFIGRCEHADPIAWLAGAFRY